MKLYLKYVLDNDIFYLAEISQEDEMRLLCIASVPDYFKMLYKKDKMFSYKDLYISEDI